MSSWTEDIDHVLESIDGALESFDFNMDDGTRWSSEPETAASLALPLDAQQMRTRFYVMEPREQTQVTDVFDGLSFHVEFREWDDPIADVRTAINYIRHRYNNLGPRCRLHDAVWCFSCNMGVA